MRVTQWGELGVQFCLRLAERGEGDLVTVGAAQLAEAQGIALDYAQQILQRLRKGGIITSVRGPSGGYRLARPPEEITLRDILIAAEGDTFELICEAKPLNSVRCNEENFCGLRTIWRDLREHVDLFLNRHTVASLLELSVIEERPVQIGGFRELER